MSTEANSNGSDAGADWSDQHRFEVIIAIPVVRDAVSTCAAHARIPISAEEFLARAAVVLPAIGRAIHNGAAARGRAKALQRGWHTGKTRDAEIPAPVGRVVAAVLCSMAFHGQPVHAVQQRETGCTLTAEIPSDRKTFGGILQVTIDRSENHCTTVHANAEIPGQLYDWGKSKQTLTALFADILALPNSKTLGIGITAAATGP